MSDLGKYAVAFSAVSGFMEDLGAFVKDRLTAMNGVNRENLLQLLASALVGLVDSISEVVAERTKDNQAYLNAAPAVLPHQLVKILPCNFSNILQYHWQHLEYIYSAIQIEAIECKHKALCDLYNRDPNVKGSIDSLDNGDSFDAAWTGLRSTYLFLKRFVSGLASIFSSTSTIESNFLVTKFEKNNNRTTLSDVSLEGIIHAKQYRLMCSLNIWF